MCVESWKPNEEVGGVVSCAKCQLIFAKDPPWGLKCRVTGDVNKSSLTLVEQ